MQTQCPHCKSRYRLSPEMIEAYGGFVRCGNCDYKFNVHDQVRLENDYFELSDENAVQENYIADHPGAGRREPGAADRVEPRLDAPEEDELNIRFRADEYEFEEDRPDMPEKKIEPRFEFPSLGDSQDIAESMREMASEHADDGLLESDQQNTDSPVEEDRAEEDLVEEDRVEEDRAEEDRAEEDRAEEGRAEEDRAEEDRAEEGRAEEDLIEEDLIEEDLIEEDLIEKDLIEEDLIEKDRVEADRVEADPVEEDPVEEDPVEEDPVEEDQAEEGRDKDVENQTTGAFYKPFEETSNDRESNEPDEGQPDKSSLSVQSIEQAAQDQIDGSAADFDDFHFGENFEVEDDDQRIEPSFSSHGLINDEAEEGDSGSGVFQLFVAALGRLISFAFWLIAAIALAYLLLGQIKDRVYPAYKNTPLVQNIRDGVCGFLPCVDAKYDIDQYEIVVSRMDEINAERRQLRISVFLLNKAQHAQEYPNILITLKRMDGSTAGRRIITPEEYTTSHNSLISSTEGNSSNVTKALIKPNKLGKILIQFDKPPADAVGFEARVVP